MPSSTASCSQNPSMLHSSQHRPLHSSQHRPLHEAAPDALSARDVFGRNILHVCVISNDPRRLAQVLLSPASKSLLAATDYENGWNVLHYVFFLKRMACFRVIAGHTAASLLHELLKRKDRCRRDPLSLMGNDSREFAWVPEYINENDQFHLVQRQAAAPTAWWQPERGASAAYTVGHDGRPVHVRVSRDAPPPRVRALHVGNSHAALVTVDGEVYTSGDARWGRLGHGGQSNGDFKVVPSLCAVRELAVSNGHNVAVTSTHRVFSWGLNNHGQLGYESRQNVFGKRIESYEHSPSEVSFFRKTPQPLEGVAVSNVHSVVYTADTLYMWGLNIGQMGVAVEHGEDFVVGHTTHVGSVHRAPVSVAIREKIRTVAACDTCTVAVTETNEVVVMHGQQRAKVPKMAPRVDTELHFKLFKPSVMTRAPVIRKAVVKSLDRIFLLLDSGDIVQCCFNATSPKASVYRSVWTPNTAEMQAFDMGCGQDGSLVLCTANGAAFTAAAEGSRRSSQVEKQRFDQAEKDKLKFRQIHGINRVVRVCCSDSFSTLGLLRDEIDPLPLKLQQNDFFKDMEYLSPLVEADPYRKQDQLLDVDHQQNCYVWPQYTAGTSTDPLFQAYSERHTSAPIPPQTYQTFSPEDLQTHKQLLRSCAEREAFQLDWSTHKFCDGKLVCPGVTLGFHHGLFYQRSSLCRQIFNDKDEYFVDQGIKGHYHDRTIVFETPVEPVALLVFVHYMYTNTVLDFWASKSEDGQKKPKEQQIRRDFRSLMVLFHMDSYENDASYLRQMAQVDDQYGDVVVGLAEGAEIRCPAYLVCRSAFFETILAWDADAADKYVNLENVTESQMRVIMRHLQGGDDMAVLAPEKARFTDADDFVNFVLDIMDISDELLLVQLKRLCESAVQDHISIDNVLVLLSHSEGLNAQKLFMSCCWFIYHNLGLVAFDPYFKDIDEELWKKVENVLEFLDKCKRPDFVVGEKGEVDWNVTGSTPPSPEQFVFDMARHNDAYMSDKKGFSSFLPVFEVDDTRRRKSSRKASRSQSERALSMSGRTVSISEMRADLQKIALSGSEYAIEDEAKTSEEKGVKKGAPVAREDKSAKSAKAPWADLSQNRRDSEPKPIPLLGEPVAEKRPTRIKFSPAMKLSQKERKAKNQASKQPVLEKEVNLRNPWGRPEKGSSSSVESSSAVSALQDLPVLGQEPKEKAKKKLSNVMLEEATRAAEAASKPTKTMQEIQQEQEFARWWEEECRRVQMEEENLMRMARGEPKKGRGRRKGTGPKHKPLTGPK